MAEYLALNQKTNDRYIPGLPIMKKLLVVLSLLVLSGLACNNPLVVSFEGEFHICYTMPERDKLFGDVKYIIMSCWDWEKVKEIVPQYPLTN